LKKKPEKQYNPFDNFSFWLQLVSMDFSFEEITNTESDISGSEMQSKEAMCSNPQPISSKNDPIKIIIKGGKKLDKIDNHH
jgi:hypothetical protein